MRVFLVIIVFFLSTSLFAQITSVSFETYPVFDACKEQLDETLKNCFETQLQNFVFENFKISAIAPAKDFEGVVSVFFEVTQQGTFKVIYIDTPIAELKTETARVFSELPIITPAMYNGNPTITQYTMPIQFPLVETNMVKTATGVSDLINNEPVLMTTNSSELEQLENEGYTNEEYTSNLNIPLSHHTYTRFDAQMNKVGLNAHTAQKPFIYSEVNNRYDFQAANTAISKNKTSWLGRKFWDEHMVAFKGEDYWFTLDPGVDLQLGKADDINTYNNTRLVQFQGGLGKNISFAASVFESQGRFAGYFNRFAESIRPDGGNPAIIPGRGIAAQFREDSYDYPVATGHVSINASKWFNVQLGHGKNFIGDGYRSLLLSDNASPYPFLKLNTTFWRLKYTNTWMSLRDVRPEVTADGSFRTKYVANHYLSYNITNRLNIGLFESVIWENDNDRGFDFNYLNPVIFYRAIEFSTGSRGGNALLGLSGKYKISNKMNVYGQFLIDEFSSSDVFGGEGSYKNKTGYQIGVKYYNAFGVDNLYLQAEYNRVRPFAYSHNTITLNYGHNNQSLAHTLGANFSEFIAIGRYQRGRLYGDAKFIIAKRGLELNAENTPFYGGNIYGTEDDRIRDNGNEIGQGNTTNFFHAELEGGYLLNPSTNLKVYGSLIIRDFSPEINTDISFKNNTTWVNFGVRTDVFNWYYDF